MHAAIRAQGFELSAAIGAFVHREIASAMAPFSEEIISVAVFLKDINGPKGGIDKQVVLRIRLRDGRQVALHTERDDLYAAIRVSARRARRAVRRSLARSRRIEKLSLAKHLAHSRFAEGPAP